MCNANCASKFVGFIKLNFLYVNIENHERIISSFLKYYPYFVKKFDIEIRLKEIILSIINTKKNTCKYSGNCIHRNCVFLHSSYPESQDSKIIMVCNKLLEIYDEIEDNLVKSGMSRSLFSYVPKSQNSLGLPLPPMYDQCDASGKVLPKLDTPAKIYTLEKVGTEVKVDTESVKTEIAAEAEDDSISFDSTKIGTGVDWWKPIKSIDGKNIFFPVSYIDSFFSFAEHKRCGFDKMDIVGLYYKTTLVHIENVFTVTQYKHLEI
jgi:hypothetical protein